MAATYTITLNGTNCTAKQLVSPVDRGADATVIIQAKTGYYFADTWKVTYMDYDEGMYVRKTCVLSENGTQATFELTSIGSNITINATAVVIPTQTDYKIITALTQCSVEPLAGFNKGDTVELTVTATRFYYFGSNSPYVRYTNVQGEEVTHPFNMTDAGTGTITITDANSNITVTGVATKTPNAITYNGATLHNAKANLPQFLNFETQYTVIVTVESGYKFEAGANCGVSWDTYGRPIVKNFTISADGKSATGTFTTPKQTDIENFTINGVGTPVPTIEFNGVYGSINAYTVTDEQLQAFSAQRYVKEVDAEGNPIYSDMGDFVLRLHRVYVPVGETKATTLKAGRYNTGIETEAFTQDVTQVVFDPVNVPTPNNDITDYSADVELYLPFVGTIQLDANTVVGREVGVKYVINVVTGAGAALVTVGGVTIHNAKCKAVSPMLYRSFNNEQYGELTTDNNTQQGLTPYIVIRYNESRQAQPYNANKRDRIGNFTGRNTFVDIDNLQTDGMYLAEYSDILNRLQQGVVIEPTGTNP